MTQTALARNIINQLGDLLYEALVAEGVDTGAIIRARQATNDRADEFVTGLLEARPTTPPSAHLQYKGTDICLDFYCECGESGHFDGYFAYAIECNKCGRKYDLPTTVALLPYSEQAETVVAS